MPKSAWTNGKATDIANMLTLPMMATATTHASRHQAAGESISLCASLEEVMNSVPETSLSCLF
jgi:hypothetical protein